MRTLDVVLYRGDDREEVRAWLQRHGVAVEGVGRRKIRIHLMEDSPLWAEIGELPAVDRLEPYVPPQLHNDRAQMLVGLTADSPASVSSRLIPHRGAGEIVAVADTGLDESHPDFKGRIARVVARGRRGDATDPHGHGTHVAATVLGDGSALDGRLRGAAPEAQLFFQSILDAHGGLGGLPVDLFDLFEEAYQAGARIHNNSWGAATKSVYKMNSMEVDEFVSDHRDMLIVISAGNEGQARQRMKSAPGFVDWVSVGSPATCKNALTVGASRSSRTTLGLASLTHGQAFGQRFPDCPIAAEKVSGDPESIAGFSSRGPCVPSRRIKPDLVAPGTDIASARSAAAPLSRFWGSYPGTHAYAILGGTSMSAPLAAGCAALVREYYVKERRIAPSAALLKATLINGTRQLTGSDAIADHPELPNFHQGFGCLYMPWTLPNRSQPWLDLEFVDAWNDPSLHLGRTNCQRFEIGVAAGGPLRICLCWTEAPGPGLWNNLNLLVEHRSSRRKWTGNVGLPESLTPLDQDNNVEIVRLDDPPQGKYRIQITAETLLRPDQDFALVVTGSLGSELTRV